MAPDFAARRARLSELLQAADCPAMACVPGANFYYLTGVSLHLMERPTILLVTREGHSHALIPDLERSRWSAAMPDAQTIYWTDQDGYERGFCQLARACPVPRLAVEGARMRQFEAEALSHAYGHRVTDGSQILRPLRLAKDATEIAFLHEAIKVSETALEATWAAVGAGMSEMDIRARLILELFTAGADDLSFDPIVLCAGASADCHGTSSKERLLRPGEPLLIDFGARIAGYNADLTRTVFCQYVRDAHRHIYEAVARANAVGREMAGPGVTPDAIDRAVTQTLIDAGYAGLIKHKTGHGLGLDVHEAPAVMVGNFEALSAGAVFTIEPGLYAQGDIGVRIEDNILITAQGSRSLSTVSRDVRLVG